MPSVGLLCGPVCTETTGRTVLPGDTFSPVACAAMRGASQVPVRMTRQRRAIPEALKRPGEHLTADGVQERVRRRRISNISLGTVYRNLEILSRAGLIRKLCLGGGSRQYDGGIHRHDHVRCVECGRIEDVPADPFADPDAAARRSSDFERLGHPLEFEGLCADCRKSAKRTRKRAR